MPLKQNQCYCINIMYQFLHLAKTLHYKREIHVLYILYLANTRELRSKRPCIVIWAPPSEFVSSSIPSWQISNAHAQPFRGTRDLAFCLKIPLDSLLVWASSEGSGETARMRRLAWTFAARIGDKYQIRLTRSNICFYFSTCNIEGKAQEVKV